MPFGKYKGMPLGEIPRDYLSWCVSTVHDLDFALEEAMYWELRRRPPGDPGIPSSGREIQPVVAKLEDRLKSWYRQTTLKYHPDRGGSNEIQAVVNDCYESLCAVIGEMGGAK
jgi:hypothetical protein